MTARAGGPIRLGLRPNAAQLTLLVLVNALVGATIGLERSILPALAEQEFGLVATTATLSFIVVFGISKALTNYFAGRLSDRVVVTACGKGGGRSAEGAALLRSLGVRARLLGGGTFAWLAAHPADRSEP